MLVNNIKLRFGRGVFIKKAQSIRNFTVLALGKARICLMKQTHKKKHERNLIGRMFVQGFSRRLFLSFPQIT